MADERISQLRRLPKDAAAATDVLPIVDVSASQTKKIQLDDLVAAGVDLIPSGEIDLSKLDQASATKLGESAIASGAITAIKLADDSSVVVDTVAPSGDTFDGRGYFNSSTGNLQIFNGSSYQQVIMPSGGIGDGQVTTSKLANGAVTTEKVSPLESAAYASGSVVTAALADQSVTAEKIASGTITANQLAAGAVSTASLGSAVVTYDKLQNTTQGDVLLGRISGSGTIEEIPLTAAGRALLANADAAEQRDTLGLGTLALANGTWTEGSSFSGTSTGTNTGDQTITLTGDVTGTGTGSFATTIADDAVTEAKVINGAITESKIADGAVSAGKLGDNSGVVAATSVPIGDGAFIGQQWVNTNTGWEYTWTGTEWQRLQGVSEITFDNSSPFTFSSTFTDPFTAQIIVGQSTQQAGQVLAGPVSGEDAAPVYRPLEPTDLPVATDSTTGISRPGTGLAIAEGVVNHSNAIASGLANGISYDAQGHITAAVPLVATDIPDLDAAKITTGEFGTDRYADDSVTGPKLADYATAKIGETLPVADYTGQIFFNPLAKSFFLWDGNVWQPIGISIGGIELGGTYDASGNTVLSTTAKGLAVGLVTGSGLPAADSSNQNYYVIVASGGTGVAPAPAVALAPPDIILSDGTAWVEVDVSTGFVSQTAAQIAFTPAGQVSASNVQAAIEEVSSECRDASNISAGTLAVARGGTSLSSYTKGDFIVASGATALSRLGVGSNGQVLLADSTADLGVRWGAVSGVGTVTNVSSTTPALVVASGTSGTTPSLSIASASTSASGIVMLTDSTSTTSSVLAATATAVKSVADVANGALQASGSTVTGQLRIGTTGSLVFEGSVDDANKTTLAVANPTATRTITLPNETGTVITSAGSGVVTSTMILDGTIVNADINNSAAIALSKLATGALPSGITIASANIVDGTIVNADIGAAAAIAGTKISPDFGGQNVTTSGNSSASNFVASSAGGGLLSALTDQSTCLSGDQSSSAGANVLLFGASHATTPSRFLFRQGTTTRMQIASTTGNVSINSATDTGDRLYVNGTVRAADQIKGNSGDAVSTPGFTWAGDENTGVFRQASDSVGIAAGGAEVCRLNTGGTSGRRQIYFPATSEVWSAGSLFLEGVTDVRSATVRDATTASAANVFISSTSGLLQRSTSSVKYKTEIEDAGHLYSESLVYGSRPVWYRSLCENDPSGYSYWGFIAEEVAEIDPRMVHWGGENGDEPEGVQYDRYVVHLVNVIQRQKEQLDAIEARLAALEGR